MNDIQSSEHEWKLDTSAVSADRELVTICVARPSVKSAGDLQHIVSAYEGTLQANGTQEFIVTATTFVKKVDELIDQLIPFGIKCMSRTSLELDHHEHRFL
jgi:acetolactate synthase small subunit